MARGCGRRRQTPFRRELQPVTGIEAALDAIEAPTCVASSGSQEKMLLTLGLTGSRGRFEARIFSADEVERGKPAPDLFLLAAARLAREGAIVFHSMVDLPALIDAGPSLLPPHTGGK